uniref:zinc-dependent alcohol dehydrogenase family protein n=1 Tax=Rhodoblastus sp. TaxID=1962975 RepID=UPI0035B0C2D5
FAVGDAVVSAFFPGWEDGAPPFSDFATVPGDGQDGYAREVVTISAKAFTRAPKNFTHAEAATLTTAGLTAWRALHDDGQLKAGETVLVQGTGGVSIFALQFAKMAGATVIATSSSAEKLEKLSELGADYLIDYRKNPNWGELARDFTDGRGVDHVIEIGGPNTLEQSMTAARIGGHIALIGILTGLAGPFPMITALLKQLQLKGVLVGSRRQQIEMIRAIDANRMKPVIDRSFRLEGLADAFKYQETNKHFGKICLEF